MSSDLCFEVVCLNGGTCDQSTGNCNCPDGFRGTTCEIEGKHQEACYSVKVFVIKYYNKAINKGYITVSSVITNIFHLCG